MKNQQPDQPPETDSKIKELFHQCWTEAHDSPDYKKENWKALQTALSEAGIET